MLTREAIQAELDRVLASPHFASAGRLGPFLRYLVEKTVSGDTALLKESLLGIEFFQRGPGFDPRLDPIVRVEARRLRARVEKHYAETPDPRTVRIVLQRGSYIPTFQEEIASVEPATEVQPGAPSPRRFRWGVAVLGLTVVVGAILGWRTFQQRPPKPTSLCVLPVSNLTGDPSHNDLADGLTEELIDSLSRLPALRVTSRGVAFQFRGGAIDPREVGRRTGVGSVVEASLRKEGGRFKVSARLVDTGTGYQSWAGSLDRPPGEVFELERDLSNAIAEALQVPERAGHEQKLSPRYTKNFRVYQLYLKARSLENSYSPGASMRALDLVQEIQILDPKYAPAQALAATIYSILGYYELPPTGESWLKANEWADKALAADPSLAEAHAARGFILAWHQRRWREAEEEFVRAVALNPDSADAHLFGAVSVYLPLGRFAEAEREFRRSLELEPNNFIANYTYGFCLWSAGRPEQAITQYEKALDIKADFADVWSDYGLVLASLRRPADAMNAFRRAAEVEQLRPWSPGVLELASVGQREAAVKLAREKLRAGLRPREKSVEWARALAVAGLLEPAVDFLGKAIDRHESDVLWIKIDPRFRALRPLPRFQAYLRQLGLE